VEETKDNGWNDEKRKALLHGFIVVCIAIAAHFLLAKQSELPQLRSSRARGVLWIGCFDQAGRDPTLRLIEGSPEKSARGSPLIKALICALIEASIN
jgi:hypothetical protein